MSSSLFNFSDGSYFELREIFNVLSGTIGAQIMLAIIIVVLGAIVWKYEKSGYGVSAYLIMAGIFGVGLSPTIKLFFGVMTSIGIAMIIYKIYDSRGT